MIKRMDKRGQEISLNMILLLVLGGLVVVVAYLFFSGTIGRVGSLPGAVLPNSVQTAVSFCNSQTYPNWNADNYCGISRVIQLDSGDEMQVSCKYLKVDLKNAGIEDPTNGAPCSIDIEKSYCTAQATTSKDLSKIYVNGKSCSDWTK
ncbi:MAG: hypothetical protein Q7S56_01035 [Nanoarchaeota archaeon]|nr:hypothetical protein [Nanoarchaeota archaeon]